MNVRHMCTAKEDLIQKYISIIKKQVEAEKVMMYSKSFCPFCFKVENFFRHNHVKFKEVLCDLEEDGNDYIEALKVYTNRKTVPNIFINGKNIGGASEMFELHEKGELVPILDAAGLKHLL